ncbi:MAG TPA: glycoside hydrolase/phage tail family protein, partial [Beijerinckiaceae bacterium]
AAFFGAAAPAHFAVAGEAVMYAGPDEWSFRRCVLHYAHLALAAGGVDGFVIGSELVGLTRVRSASGVYPAVTRLCALAADVRAVLGPGTKIVYAADWTEYGAHVLGGGAEVRFTLDPLWAHPAIDAVGIDFYPPLSDWRDGPDHADLAEARSAYDVDYLRARVASGEAFNWYYTSAADRQAQTRAAITDGAYGKPWVFRAKDLAGWWSNPHVERVGGVETTVTSWVPQAKPIWLTETGVPAVDKGANGPNVFPDPKSSENVVPPFSRGTRDDLIQSRALEAILSRFDPALPGHPAGANPVSPVYGGPMVDPARVFVWAWDARPFPAFPDFDTVWADAANWQAGHWITGRLEGMPVDRFIAAVLSDFGLEPAAELAVDGFLDGYVVDRPMSAREALEPLARLFGIDAVARAGDLAFRGRGLRAATALAADDLVKPDRNPALRLVRAQETELPRQVEIGFTDGEGDYRRAAVASRRLTGASRREARADAAVVTRRAEAQRLADAWLQDLWAGRETAEFEVARRHLAFEPGDMLLLPTDAGPRLHRVTRIADGLARRVSTRAAEPSVYTAPAGEGTRPPRRPPLVAGAPEPILLDLPVARGEPTVLQYLAVAADPWPGAVAVWRGGEGGFVFDRTVDLPAVAGRTLTLLPTGPLWRWDTTTVVDVALARGALPSVSDEEALAGANLFAVRGGDSRWEILCAARAELVAEKTYRLSRLLRGLAGSEPEAARTLPAGATVVRLDEAVTPLTDALADLGVAQRTRIGPADRDHADPAYVEIAATANGDALRPLAPVHVRARREADGVHVTWIRRARRDADAWEPVEVPLGEDSERYEVDILNGAAVVRTIAVAVPEALYAAAQELADFGAAQATLSLRVAQMSATVGRGFERAVMVAVV